MRHVVAALFLFLSFSAFAQDQAKTPTLKGILLAQLRTTHNDKDWFVPANIAVAGLTPEQASWRDNAGNHPIGQLANHLVFWNQQQLAKFKGEAPPKYSGDNNETFNSFDTAKWAATVQQLDKVLADWETAIETADDAKLRSWYSTIAHISTHNAYHIGQIVYIRKLQRSWDPEKGVK